MRSDVNVHLLDFFVLIAIFQAAYISFFIIRNGRKYSYANVYQGLFLLSFAVLAFEEFLNNTGYITRILPLTSFSQPFNFFLGPFFYLYITASLYPDQKRRTWIHFILPVFWCFYIWFYLAQPNEVKYNAYISLKHPDWQPAQVVSTFSQDPLGIRFYANELTILSLLAYDVAALVVILKKLKSLNQTFFNITQPQIAMVRNSFVHCIVVALLFSALKLAWGMTSDVGMIVVPYFCIYIFIISYRITSSATYFNQPFSVLDFPVSKYQKSSLSEEQKDEILKKIRHEMEVNHYFADNLSSLGGLAKKIRESTHHVSQVINERLHKTYFELVSSYRIEYAKQLLKEETGSKLTIEELVEKVGYNSKSSFNTAFKKQTSLTPTEYRKSLKIN